jgi:transposase
MDLIKKGLEILNHPQNGKRKPIFTKEIRKKIINLLKDKPKKYGLWQASWSLQALAKVAIKSKIVERISFVRIWQIFKEEGHSYQKSKDWINSPDPQYDFKKNY